MNKITNSQARKRNAFSVMFMAVMMMTVTVSITLTYSAVVLSGSRQAQDNIDSVKAFYAAESVAERIIYYISKGDFDPVGNATDGQAIGTSSVSSAYSTCLQANHYLKLPENPQLFNPAAAHSCLTESDSTIEVGQIEVRAKYVQPDGKSLRMEVAGQGERTKRIVELAF